MNTTIAATVQRPAADVLEAYHRLMTDPRPWPDSAPDPANLLAAVSAWQNTGGPSSVETDVVDLGTADGWSLTATVYRPPAQSDAAETVPVLFLHGGAWVLGNPASHDRMARQIAGHGHPVWSLDYPRAPKGPFPAAVNSSILALETMSEAFERPVAVCGDSAGGGLAASAALALPDQIAGLGLMYPVVDYHRAASWVARFHRHLTTADSTDPYLGEAAEQLSPTDWRLNPLAHAHQLPPTWIGYGTADPLAEQSTLLETALHQARTPVVVHRAQSSGHAFMQDPEDANAPAAYESLGQFLFNLTGTVDGHGSGH